MHSGVMGELLCGGIYSITKKNVKGYILSTVLIPIISNYVNIL